MTALVLTEDDLSTAVLSTANTFGWYAHHGRPARTKDGWRTPIQGQAGFVDWVFARRGDVRFVELKSEKGRLSPEQKRWMAMLVASGKYRLWRPIHWWNGTIEDDLR